MNGENRHFYRFKSFRLDVEERRLMHHNLPVPLTPKAFDVLAVLVEQNGHLVEKEEILRTVWADSFVEEANVARIIHTLRKTLGKDENGRKFIETVAKKGYRFVAEVTEISEQFASPNGNGQSSSAMENLPVANFADVSPENNPQISAPPRETIAAPAIPVRVRQIVFFGTGFVCAVLLLFLLLVKVDVQPISTLPRDQDKSIAILPFRSLNAAKRDELYEVGIADSLIHRLSRLKGVVVRPLSATRKYAESEPDSLLVGKEQKVDYVLTSTYQMTDGKIRITAQLFNVATGKIEETYKSEKDFTGIFALQDALADELGNLLQTRFATTSASVAAKCGTTNEEAYRLYLHGKNLTSKRRPTDVQKPLTYFTQAIALDPNFACAYSGLAYAYIMSGRLNGMPPQQVFKAREAIDKALELDNNSAEGYEVRGFLKLVFDWDFAGAEKDLRRAAEFEPNSVQGLEFRAEYLASQGKLDEALAVIETAIKLDPNSPALQHERGRLLYRARRYDEAILVLTRLVEVDENFIGVYGTLQIAYEKKNDYAGAFDSFMNFVKRTTPEQSEIYQNIYETDGWHAVQRKHIEFRKIQGKSANGNSGAWNYGLAMMSALSGEKEAAFEYLDKAAADRPAQMIRINVEPAFDILRDDPRFDELVRRVGLK